MNSSLFLALLNELENTAKVLDSLKAEDIQIQQETKVQELIIL